MFDEQEQKLLGQALTKAQKDYRSNPFDENFDRQLRKLVLHYSFDFEAIALHLYFMFPQYSFRLKPQAVSYRWYQLTLQTDGERIRKEIEGLEKQEGDVEVGEGGSQEEETEQFVMFNLGEKKFQYQTALKMAEYLDEEEEEGFMVYRPKFIVDSQFKLQRQKSQNTLILSALLGNELNFQFGGFDAPLAAPIDSFHSHPIELAAPMDVRQSIQEQQKYMDDDWQAYESD